MAKISMRDYEHEFTRDEKRLKSIFFNLPEYSLGAFIILLSLVVVFEIVARVLFRLSVFGYTQEICSILFMWLSFLGISVGVKRGTHFSFSLLAKRMKPGTVYIIEIITSFVVLSVSLLFLTVGVKVTILALEERYIQLLISRFWQYLSIPVSGALMFIYISFQLINQIKSKKAGTPI